MLQKLNFLALNELIPPQLIAPSMFLIALIGSTLVRSKIRSVMVSAMLIYLLTCFHHMSGNPVQDALLPIQGLIILARFIDMYVLHYAESREGFLPVQEYSEKGDRKEIERR
jgi:hypothetical protein